MSECYCIDPNCSHAGLTEDDEDQIHKYRLYEEKRGELCDLMRAKIHEMKHILGVGYMEVSNPLQDHKYIDDVDYHIACFNQDALTEMFYEKYKEGEELAKDVYNG